MQRSQSALGVLRRLVSSTSGGGSVEAVARQLQASAPHTAGSSSVLLPLPQLCWLHSPATPSFSGGSTHAYHHDGSDGSGAGSGNGGSSSGTRGRSRSRRGRHSSGLNRPSTGAAGRSPQQPGAPQRAAATQQLRDLQDAVTRQLRRQEQHPQQQQQPPQHLEGLAASLEERQQEVLHASEGEQLPEHVARNAMRDPLGVLMASQGVPLGISLRVNAQQLLQQQADGQGEADKADWRELLGQHDEASGTSSTTTTSYGGRWRRQVQRLAMMEEEEGGEGEEPSTSLPNTDAQLLRRRLLRGTRSLVSATQTQRERAAAAAAEGADGAAAAEPSSSCEEEEQGEGSEAPAAHQPGGGGARGRGGVGRQVKEQLAALLASVEHDSWGTTQQSPADIARHIADSNRGGGGGAGGGPGDGNGRSGGGGEEEEEEGDDDDEPLELNAAEQRYVDPSAVASDLKEMDEIFEVLAKVPWLDDEDVEERELRGLVAVGLLGTLEEVGWQLRGRLLALWQGERDIEVLTAGAEPKEAAALQAVLYHMQQLEQQYGAPPEAGVAAAVAAVEAAASGGSGDGGGGPPGAGGGGEPHQS